MTLDNGCPNPVAATYPETVRVIIESINFSTNSITLRNVGTEPISFRADRGWSLAIWPRTVNLTTTVIPGSSRVTFHLTDSGADDAANMYLDLGGGSAELNARRGEISFYSANKESGPFRNPEEIEAFLRWGAAPMGSSASVSGVAASAGLWTNGQFVATSDAEVGLIVNGDITDVWSWTPVGAECF
jgi:hypothetical protein